MEHARGLTATASWVSDDSVDALDLPLASAAEKVLASMHEVLSKTCESMDVEVQKATDATASGPEGEEERQTKLHLLKSRAAELKLVRHLDSMRHPQVRFKAQRVN